MSVKTYCTYGLYDEDNASNLAEGDFCSIFTYWHNGEQISVRNVKINDIYKDRVVIELEDGEEATIQVDDIVEWID